MKTKLFFVLLFFISLFAFSVHAQDTRIYIGRAWLRYDSDSNKIKIGGNPVPKIAREFDAQLFDFNTNQFAWDRTKGLCLNTLMNYDSSKVKKLIIYSDTGNGESIPYRSRSYTIYKPFYANAPDLYDLKIQYISTNDITEKSNMTELNLINTQQLLFENLPQQDISGIGYVPMINQFLRKGTYLITLSYEYEFINAIDDGEEDVNVIINFNSNDIRNYHHRWRHSRFNINEIRFPACITFPLVVTDPQQVLSVTFYGNIAPSSSIYLYNLNVTAILIN